MLLLKLRLNLLSLYRIGRCVCKLISAITLLHTYKCTVALRNRQSTKLRIPECQRWGYSNPKLQRKSNRSRSAG